MTPQEQQMIAGLIDRVQHTQLPEKDSDAEAMLQGGLGRNPDSLYILSQTVLVQQYALDQATKQLADLKAQLDQSRQQAQPKHATSFLGSIFGSQDEDKPVAPPPPPAYNQRPSTPAYAPVQNYGQAGSPPPGSGQGGFTPASTFGAPSSAGGGFLRSALQTATGVAAGALAFQGIESLMHGFGGGGMGFGGGGGRSEEVINNYYGDGEHHDDRSGLSSDIDDRRGDGSFFNPGQDASSDADNTDRLAGNGDDDTSSLDDDSSNSDDDSSNSGDDSSDSGNDDFGGGGDDFGGGGDDSSFS